MTCFLLIGIIIFEILQYGFMPKRYPYDKTNDAGKLKYFLSEEKNSIDVFIVGTSHTNRGILPMEIYESYGIKSYNLSTSAQPIEATYYLLQEAIERQCPQVVVWDVSNLYLTYNDPSRWKTVIDEIPIGKSKVELAEEYIRNLNNAGESLVNLIFPLIEYHSRWKKLERDDFNIIQHNKYYFGKGGQINSTVAGGISVDLMNSISDELSLHTIKDIYEYRGQESFERHEDDILYSSDIVDSNIEWLIKMKELCDANNIYLLAVKLPAVDMPQIYSSAWTEQRYKKTRTTCEEYNIAYYDLLYDANVNYDNRIDSCDAGKHLNLYGAQKVSKELGSYLSKKYQLSDEHYERWDKDLLSYQKVRKVALLELEQDFYTYINLLSETYKDNTVFIAASDDMISGLNGREMDILKTLGLRIDFSEAYRNSYIAVIEDGMVKYEASSNRSLDYTGICDKSGKNYSLHSDGWWTGSSASIKLDDKEYAVNHRGMNIVVYDGGRGLVLDSVAFDTCEEYHAPIRNNAMINQLEEEFEHYIMEVEDK